MRSSDGDTRTIDDTLCRLKSEPNVEPTIPYRTPTIVANASTSDDRFSHVQSCTTILPAVTWAVVDASGSHCSIGLLNNGLRYCGQ